MKPTKQTISAESQAEAMKIAKATQRQGQSKEHTKLIAQGIEKGISLYKKQQKEKKRQADKTRKKSQKVKQQQASNLTENASDHAETNISNNHTQKLPWLLLLLSWLGFLAYLLLP
ncbi:DUF2956 family protein [Vibrio sp. TH_r3]|uniref:DUF2956 family protein n=1 Tax=Vibrio sp. TH_r3 TaxID=3082084 RepID=UPI002953EF21|nr:DUF2956 family protein [Vibrio sp. TH_r3]MDV7105082.1 DUF2956 family protein [Vibrio sp. TH_r3]